MAVSLYTVRVLFNILGTDNYGIYNVVGGIIVFFSFLNNGLTSATKRFVTTEIAKNDVESGRHIFNICVIAHIIISVIILVLAETIGLWLVNNVLNIPEERIFAANCVFQMSILATVVGVMQSPFEATIVAYERMNIYAYVSVVDVVFKLAIAFILAVLPGDKLIWYSLLFLFANLTTIAINRFYCYRNFPICKWRYRKDPQTLKKIFSFMSWSLLGQMAVVGTNQGVSMLINIYYSVAVNAAMGVSNQVTGSVNRFVSNFQVAFNPQIIKSYANKDFEYLKSLIMRSSKVSSFLIIIFLVPLLFETPRVLSLWLGDYPQYSVEFCLLTLVGIYLEAIGAPLWMLQYSQTNIKRYQVTISAVYGSIFFLSWLLFLSGNVEPYMVIAIRIFVFIILLGIRLVYAQKLLPTLRVKSWVWEILIRGLVILVISGGIVGIIAHYLSVHPLLHIIITTGLSLCVSLPLMYFVGLDKSEAASIHRLVQNKISRYTLWTLKEK